MDRMLRELAFLLLGTALAVAALFAIGALSRKFKINWLTKFLMQPDKQNRPPGWLVLVAGILLVALSVTWFALPVERRLILRNHLLGP